MATLNHIGIAVKDKDRMAKLFALLQFKIDHTEIVPQQHVTTHFIPLPSAQTQLELLEPLDDQGAIFKFLQKSGPGIHHLSFSVPKGQLDPLCERLSQEGFRLVYPQPQPGAHGMKVNFLHPATAGGILIELMEPS